MKNSIKVEVEFYFKGERFNPSAIIDLDEMLHSEGECPDWYLYLAEKNQIDSYSYHYEVMLMEPIHFSQATGLAQAFLVEHQFDIAAYQSAWKQNQIIQTLQAIALEQMQIDDLQQYPDLKRALLSAYEAGRLAKRQD